MSASPFLLLLLLLLLLLQGWQMKIKLLRRLGQKAIIAPTKPGEERNNFRTNYEFVRWIRFKNGILNRNCIILCILPFFWRSFLLPFEMHSESGSFKESQCMYACTHFDCLWQIRHLTCRPVFPTRTHSFPAFVPFALREKKVGCSHAGAWPTLIRRVKKEIRSGVLWIHIREHTSWFPSFSSMTFSKLDRFFYVYGQRSKTSTERNEDEKQEHFSSTKFTAARTHLLFPESKIETDLNDRKWDPNNKGIEWQALKQRRQLRAVFYF